MLLNDEEIAERLESPLNLLNRLRTSLTRHVKPPTSPSLPPTAEELIDGLDEKLTNTKSKARDIMNLAMDELKTRMPEVQKPEKLAQIAREMAHVVSQQEAKTNNDSGSKIIVYAPQVINLDKYDIIDVKE